MKLATLKDGSRDGHLAVVSRDGASAHFASGIAGTLQRVLDDWNFLAPQLEDLSAALNDGKARHAFAFDAAACMAPLPRAYECWQVGTGSVLQRVASADLIGPQAAVDEIPAGLDEAAGTMRFTPALAVVTGDVATAADPDAALDAVRLLLLLADVAPGCASWAPVAVTPDELGRAWRGGRPHLQIRVGEDAKKLQVHQAADGLPRHFGEWIADAASARRLRTGTVIGHPIEAAALQLPQHGAAAYLDAVDGDCASPFGTIVWRSRAAFR